MHLLIFLISTDEHLLFPHVYIFIYAQESLYSYRYNKCIYGPTAEFKRAVSLTSRGPLSSRFIFIRRPDGACFLRSDHSNRQPSCLCLLLHQRHNKLVFQRQLVTVTVSTHHYRHSGSHNHSLANGQKNSTVGAAGNNAILACCCSMCFLL